MPRESSVRLDVGYGWLRGEDWWGDHMSDNMVKMDALLHPNAKSMTNTMPPIDAIPGDQYIIAPDAAGIWAGLDNAVATRYPDRWRYVKAFKGLRVFVEDLETFCWFNGTSWQSEKDPAGGVDPDGKAYDILCSVGYPPFPEEVLLVVPIPETMTLPKGAAGSIGTSVSVPRNGAQLFIQRNGTVVGRALFPSSDFTASITVDNDVTFARGDRLTIHMGTEVPDSFETFGLLLRMILPTE